MQDGRDKNGRKTGSGPAGRAGSRNGPQKKTRFQKLAQNVGNGEINDRISLGNASRDAMLQQLCERLQVMRELQVRELALTERGAHWSWWRTAADDQKSTQQEPEPTRWNLAAERYEQAANALCQGHVMRGRQLLEDAMDLEQKAQETLTQLVDRSDLEIDTTPDRSMLDDGPAAATARPRALPEEISIAKEIYSVTTTVPDMPNRSRIKDPWWTRAEDEEDGEGEDGGGA